MILQQRGLSRPSAGRIECLSRAARWTSAAVGEKFIEVLLKEELVKDAADLYSLKEKKEQIVQLEKKGEKAPPISLMLSKRVKCKFPTIMFGLASATSGKRRPTF